MLSMIRCVRAHHNRLPPDTGPMIVHCSAGVGRTGTFVVIDSMLQRILHGEDSVDIYGHVTLLRNQRNFMVQTEVGYLIICTCIHVFFFSYIYVFSLFYLHLYVAFLLLYFLYLILALICLCNYMYMYMYKSLFSLCLYLSFSHFHFHLHVAILCFLVLACYSFILSLLFSSPSLSLLSPSLSLLFSPPLSLLGSIFLYS